MPSIAVTSCYDIITGETPVPLGCYFSKHHNDAFSPWLTTYMDHALRVSAAGIAKDVFADMRAQANFRNPQTVRYWSGPAGI